MKRETLNDLGVLSKEQIDSIMTEYGKSVQSYKDTIATQQTTIDNLTTERDGYKEQVEERDKDIKMLQDDAKGNEELSKNLSDLQKKYTDDTNALTQKLESQARAHACERLFAGIEFTSAYAKKSAMRDFMEQNPEFKDGRYVNADAIIKKMREENADAFKKAEETPAEKKDESKPPKFTGPINNPQPGEKNPFTFNFTPVRHTNTAK